MFLWWDATSKASGPALPGEKQLEGSLAWAGSSQLADSIFLSAACREGPPGSTGPASKQGDSGFNQGQRFRTFWWTLGAGPHLLPSHTTVLPLPHLSPLWCRALLPLQRSKTSTRTGRCIRAPLSHHRHQNFTPL